MALASIGSAACERSADPIPAPPPPAAVAAPAGLLFDGVAPAPQQFWQALREGLGDVGRGLPKHYPLLLTELLGVSPVMSGRFQAQLPLRLALATSAGRASWAVGVPVESGAEFVAELTTGGQAPYRRKDHGGVVEFVRAGAEPFPALGVRGNLLFIASDSVALGSLAPYLATNAPEVAPGVASTSLVLRSSAEIGPALQTLYQGWLARDAERWHADWFEAVSPASSGPLAQLFDRLVQRLTQGVGEMLPAIERSELELRIVGKALELRGRQRTTRRFDVARSACDVVANSRVRDPIAMFAWGGEQVIELDVGGAAPTATGLRGPFVLGLGTLPELSEPRTQGQGSAPADVHAPQPNVGALGLPARTVVYADVGWSSAELGLDPEAWLARLLSESDLSLLRVRTSAAGSRETARSRDGEARAAWHTWNIIGTDASQPALQLGLSLEQGRGVWWVGPRVVLQGGALSPGSALLQGGLSGEGRPLPWAPSCAAFILGASVGHGDAEVSTWLTTSADGFDLAGRVPLRAFTGLD